MLDNGQQLMPSRRCLRHRNLGPGEVKRTHNGPAAVQRIVGQAKDSEGNGSSYPLGTNGGDEVVHTGDAGAGKGKVQGPSRDGVVTNVLPCALLAAELDAWPALAGINHGQGMVSVEEDCGARGKCPGTGDCDGGEIGCAGDGIILSIKQCR